jgi:hypothetical protein
MTPERRTVQRTGVHSFNANRTRNFEVRGTKWAAEPSKEEGVNERKLKANVETKKD